jgi:hypothetical protein
MFGAASAADLCNNTNTAAVVNAPHAPYTHCVLTGPAHLTGLYTYHWNGGHGAKPGAIMLESASTGFHYGPFAAAGSSGAGGAPNVNWTASLSLDVPAGTYLVMDSDVPTWSWNGASGGFGFIKVEGTYTGAAGATGGPLPPPPKPAPPPPPPPPPPPTTSVLTHHPCHANSSTFLELAKPVCFGPPGTVLTLYVSRYGLKSKPTEILFRSGPGYSHISLMLGGGINTPSLPAVFSEPLMLTSGNGLAPDSTYTFPIPPGTCFSGKPHTWWFDIWLVGGGGGDVDAVAVKC